MQTIGCLVNDGEELTNYFGTLEKMSKPVNEFLEHSIWTRVRTPAGPQITPLFTEGFIFWCNLLMFRIIFYI
jgi:hypothetical protein